MAEAAADLPRHTMVRIAPAAWAGLLARRADLEGHSVLLDWAKEGRPLVVRRPVQGEPPDLLCLGLPLPPAMGRRRLRFQVPAGAVRSAEPPPLLDEATAAAPARWRPTLAALVALDFETRCFGSLAWAHLTGLPYLSDSSDLDLLWHVASAVAADTLAARIEPIAETAPMTVDGELVGPAGLAVQWREWRSPTQTVIGKGRADVRLAERTAVFA